MNRIGALERAGGALRISIFGTSWNILICAQPQAQELSIDCVGGCLSGEWVNGVLEGGVMETLASGGKVIIISSSIVFVTPLLISVVDTRWKDGARQEFGTGLTGRQGTSFQYQNSYWILPSDTVFVNSTKISSTNSERAMLSINRELWPIDEGGGVRR